MPEQDIPTSDLASRIGAIAARLSSAATVRAAAVLGMALTATSIFVGLVGDDYVQLTMTRLGTRRPWDLFRFLDGDSAARLAQIRKGGVPWITDPDVRIAFFRPFPSLTHFVDYRFWPSHPAVMHVENVAAYGVLILAVGSLYRALESRRALAGIATIAYAVDALHGATVGWLANRNALMAGALASLSLLLHHRARASSKSGLSAAAVFSLALLSGEASLEALGWFAAYAVFLDREAPRSRLVSLAPYAALALVFYGLERALGYGVAHTAIYLDPFRDPGDPLIVVERVASLALFELGWPGCDRLPGLPFAIWMVPLLYLAASAAVVVLGAVRDRKAAFWATSAFLALLPATATLPAARLLLVPSIAGTMALLTALAALAGPLPARRAWFAAFVLSLPIALLWIFSLFFICPVTLPTASASLDVAAPVSGHLPVPRPLVAAPDQDAIVLNHPDWYGLSILGAVEHDLPGSFPRTVTQLVSSAGFVDVERVDARTLVIRSPAGLRGPEGYLVRPAPMPPGLRVKTARCLIEVLEAYPNGEPTAIRYVFDRVLEDPSLVWFTAVPDGFVPIRPPLPRGHLALFGFAAPAPPG